MSDPIVGEIRAFAFGGDKTTGQHAAIRAAGWLECAGQDVAFNKLPRLYHAITNTWGSKSPGTTFSVPDLRGMFLRGWNHGQQTASKADPDAATRVGSGPAASGAAGDAVGSFEGFALQQHQHGIGPFTYQPWGHEGNFGVLADRNGAQGSTTGVAAGSAAAAETRPSNVYVMYAIYTGTVPVPADVL